MFTKQCWITVSFAALVAFAATPLWAQDGSDESQWRATVYGWLPDLEARTAFPSGESGPTINVEASTLVDNLDFTFQASLRYRRGKWGGFTDLVCLDCDMASGGALTELNFNGPVLRVAFAC